MKGKGRKGTASASHLTRLAAQKRKGKKKKKRRYDNAVPGKRGERKEPGDVLHYADSSEKKKGEGEGRSYLLWSSTGGRGRKEDFPTSAGGLAGKKKKGRGEGETALFSIPP